MLTSITSNALARRQGGFSLIELMIATVAGLIVVGAALTLTVSVLKSNNQTVRSARLTQELRAVSEIISRELRRAREITDPYRHIGHPEIGPNAVYNALTVPQDASNAYGTSVFYAYEGVTNPRRAICLDGNSIKMIQADIATNVTCATAGDTLSSPQVNITALTFTPFGNPPASPIVVTVTGETTDANTAERISRTFTTAVQIRSTGVPDAVP